MLSHFRILVLIALATFLAGCGDEISRKYSTLADARVDVEKGWIPPILPPSTYSIRDTHDLDLNLGEGSFLFDPKEFEVLMNGLSATPNFSSRFLPKDAERKALEKAGFSFRQHFANDTIWLVAATRDGHGRYWMELKR